MLVIPVFKRLKQKDHEFEVSLSYVANSRAAWAKSLSQNKKEKESENEVILITEHGSGGKSCVSISSPTFPFSDVWSWLHTQAQSAKRLRIQPIF